MRIKFKIPREWAELIAEQFAKYAAMNEDFEMWGGSLCRDPSRTILTHCTGNRWTVDISEGTLTYEGSREGFNALTPFPFAEETVVNAELLFSPPRLVFYAERKELELSDKDIVEYETTYEGLQWYQRIKKLEGEPDKAVVLEGNTPIKVVPYKNVYNLLKF